MPTAAKIVPSATSVVSSARGSQSATGLRASVASPAVNGKTKNASAMPPARRPRPQERRGREGYEPREGDREQQRWRRGTLPSEDPVRERERGGRDHEVQRQQEERLLGAQLDRQTERRHRKQGDRDDRRIAREWDGQCATPLRRR